MRKATPGCTVVVKDILDLLAGKSLLILNDDVILVAAVFRNKMLVDFLLVPLVLAVLFFTKSARSFTVNSAGDERNTVGPIAEFGDQRGRPVRHLYEKTPHDDARFIVAEC